MEVLILLTLGTFLAAWAGFIIALVANARSRRVELALAALQSGASHPRPRYQPQPEPGPAPQTEPAPDAEAAPPPPSRPEMDAVLRAAMHRPVATAVSAIQGAAARASAGDSAGGSRTGGGSGRPPAGHSGSGLGAMFRALERSLAGNWLVWTAGAALALGGVLLAKVAIDAGLLGPWARIGAAALAGAAMLAAGEWLRRKPDAGRVRSLAPAVLSAAGLITLYGDVYAAFALYDLIAGPVAFALLAAIAAGALLLAWLHGPVIAAFGIAGGFVAPLLIGSENPNAATLFAYVFGVTLASLAMARFARWRWTVWLSLAGGAGWPALWLLGGFDPAQALALALYLPALAGLAVAFAWSEAGEPLDIPRLLRRAPWPAPSLFAAHICFAAVAALLLWLLAAWSYDRAAVGALWALAALGLASAWRREGLGLLPVLAAIAAGLAVWWWPQALAEAALAEAEAATRATGAVRQFTPVFASAAALAALFAVGGGLAWLRLRVKGPMALAAAGAPVAILAALAYPLGQPSDAASWAALLAVVALIELAIVELIARRPSPSAGAAASYALGACAAALAAIVAVADRQWLGAAVALEAAAAALLYLRWRAPALAWAAALLGLGAVYQLTLGANYLGGPPRDLAGGISLIAAYAVSVVALDGASRVLRRADVARESAVVRTLDGAMAALAVTTAFLALRLALNGGSLTAEYDNLVEMGLQSGLWLAAPLAMRLRVSGRLTLIQRIAEAVLLTLAVAQIVAGQLLLANPWTGVDTQPVSGPPVVNALLAAYALPGVLAGALALLWRRRGFAAAPWAALGAVILLFAWLTLETRRAFHAPDLDIGDIGDAESWAYSTVWLVGAGLVMAWGVVRRVPILRYFALVALTLTTLKVFLIDLQDLRGVWRALSFLGLGAALMAIAVIYQRVVLPGEAAPASRGTPNDLENAP